MLTFAHEVCLWRHTCMYVMDRFETWPPSKPSDSFKVSWTILKMAKPFWNPRVNSADFTQAFLACCHPLYKSLLLCHEQDCFKSIRLSKTDSRFKAVFATCRNCNHSCSLLHRFNGILSHCHAPLMAPLLILAKYAKTVLYWKFLISCPDGHKIVETAIRWFGRLLNASEVANQFKTNVHCVV